MVKSPEETIELDSLRAGRYLTVLAQSVQGDNDHLEDIVVGDHGRRQRGTGLAGQGKKNRDLQRKVHRQAGAVLSDNMPQYNIQIDDGC